MGKVLGDYCQLKGGTGFPENLQGKSEGDLPFIKVSDMSLPGNQRLVVRANNYVDSATAIRLNACVFPAKSTVFAKVGAALLLNRRRMLAMPTVIDNNMMGAVPTEADPDFLYQLLSSIDFRILTQPGALPSLKKSDIEALPCPDFSRDAQRRIAEILSTVDESIEQTEALITKTQQLKAGLMHDLFTRGVTPDGQLRPPREEAPELYKESVLGWIPREWDVSPLSRVASSVTSGSRGWAQYYSDEGALFLRIGNLTRGHINLRLENAQSAEPDATRTRFRANADSISEERGQRSERTRTFRCLRRNAVRNRRCCVHDRRAGVRDRRNRAGEVV